MHSTILKESYLHGNLDVVFNFNRMKDMNLTPFFKYNEEIDENYLKKDKSSIWRYFNNMKFILSSFETYIYSNEDKITLFINLLDETIKRWEKILKIKKNITLQRNPSKDQDLFILLTCYFVRNLQEKLESHHSSLEDYQKQNLKKYLFEESCSFFIEYVTPYDDIQWSPKWKATFEEEEIVFKNTDIFLDSYVKNNNLIYNETMEENIKIFKERLSFLKENTTEYYLEVKRKIKEVTKKFFDIFPYHIIHRDYLDLIKEEEEIYFPEIITKKDKITENLWLISFLPDILKAYLLGYPVISSYIPSTKKIRSLIEKLDSLGEENYFNQIKERFNNLKIKSLHFYEEAANGRQDGEMINLFYQKIADFNQDDFFCTSSGGGLHFFTCNEYNDLIKKKENPYNRQKIHNLFIPLENLKFKSKIKKKLLQRNLDLTLDGTMLENFLELKEKIKEMKKNITGGYVFNELDLIYSPLVSTIIQNMDINFSQLF